MAVSAQNIVDSAYKLLGAPFRVWQPGDLIPLWLNDGQGDPPPVEHLQSVGVASTDLINFALEDNGLQAIGGTVDMPDNLVNWSVFDSNTPGQPGAVAIKGYEGPGFDQQGHVVLYIGEHQVIQAIFDPGVTDEYTDQWLYAWGGDFAFEWYGFLPGVEYPG
jgi:hypothetical protein